MTSTTGGLQLNQDTITPLQHVLRKYGFIEITGLVEYGLFGKRRTVGADLLSRHRKGYAMLPLNSRRVGSGSKTATSVHPDKLYLLIVTEDGGIWLGRPTYLIDGTHSATGMSIIDERLTEFRDRYGDPLFANIVHPARLRPCDLLTRFYDAMQRTL